MPRRGIRVTAAVFALVGGLSIPAAHAVPTTHATAGTAAPAAPATTSGTAPANTPTPAPADDPIGGPRMGELGVVLDLPPGVPAPPKFEAGCFLLADLDSGSVLFAKCPHTPGLPASTIKALTALALVDELAPDEVVTAVEEDAAQDGTKVGMQPGSGYTVEQLYQAMLMTSGNDAAWALARHRGMDEAVAKMNATAAHLGAHDTRAFNPSGLDAQGQVTSVYDLALIGRAVLRNERLAQYVKTLRVSFPSARVRGGGQRGSYEISNHNRLLLNYPGTIGVKNGFTLKARSTYVGAVRRGDQAYLISYLNKVPGSWRHTAALLDWAFAHGKKVRPVGTLVEPGSPEAQRPGDEAAASGADDGGRPADHGAAELAAVGPAPISSDGERVGQQQVDWLLAHPEVLLFAGGALAVVAVSLGVSARRTEH